MQFSRTIHGNNSQEQLLRQIVSLLTPPKESRMILSSPEAATEGTESIATTFANPVQPPDGRCLEMLWENTSTSYSWSNIDDTNNTFVYAPTLGSWKTISLPTGSYEVETINETIQSSMKANGDWDEANDTFYISITPNFATLKAVIEITHPAYTVDIGSSKLRSILGWPSVSTILTEGRNEAPGIVHISKINRIVVHCDLVNDSYIASGDTARQGFVLGSFYPNVDPGYKIDHTPPPSWQRVTVPEIRSIKIWLTDQDDKLINLRGERHTTSLKIRDVYIP